MGFNKSFNSSQGSPLNRAVTSLIFIVFGAALIIFAIVILMANEGRTVKRYQTLKEEEEAVVSVAASPVLDQNEVRLVHLSGNTPAISIPMLSIF